jgi:hypothetical protein
MAKTTGPKLIDFRGRPPTPEFNSYFVKEGTVAVNYRVGAKSISPAFLADSVDMFFEEMAAANIISTLALGRNPERSHPRPDAEVPW